MLSTNSENMTSRTDGNDPIRLTRQGTAIPKSSDFTRTASILHTTEIDVRVDGTHDDGKNVSETTAGVDFVSAQNRLNRIFHEDAQWKGTITSPPPPPQILPHAIAASKPSLSAPLCPLLPISPVSSGSSNLDNVPQRSLHQAGMTTRKSLRRRRLIRTRMEELPQEIQDLQPNIEGGIAVYRPSDPQQQEHYGTTIEVNVIDYVLKLRRNIAQLERQVADLNGRLEDNKDDTAGTNDQQKLRSLRRRSFIGKRSKGTHPKVASEKPRRSIPRGKTVSHLERSTNVLSEQSAERSATSSEAAPTSHKVPAAVAAPKPAKPAVNFPTGFGCDSLPSDTPTEFGAAGWRPIHAGHTAMQVEKYRKNPSKLVESQGRPAARSRYSHEITLRSSTPTQHAVKIRNGFGIQPLAPNASNISGSLANRTRNLGDVTSAGVKVHGLRVSDDSRTGKQQLSTVSSGTTTSGSKNGSASKAVSHVEETNQDQVPDTTSAPKLQESQHPGSVSLEPLKSFHGDRDTAPMPFFDSRRMKKIGELVRSRSFTGRIIARSGKPNESELDNDSRASSTGGEASLSNGERKDSISSAPVNLDQKDIDASGHIPRKTKGVRKLLRLR